MTGAVPLAERIAAAARARRTFERTDQLLADPWFVRGATPNQRAALRRAAFLTYLDMRAVGADPDRARTTQPDGGR